MNKLYIFWFTVIIVFSSSLHLPVNAIENGLSIGQPIPQFNLKTQADKEMPFNLNFRNKVVMIVLSNYCSVELAGVWGIPTYYKYYRNPNFRFVFIFSRHCLPGFIPNGFISSSIQNAVNSLRLPYILIDWDNQVTQKLKGHDKHPQIYLVDPQGKVQWSQRITTPFEPVAPMEKKLKALLDK